jgi:hypothetical protein
MQLWSHCGTVAVEWRRPFKARGIQYDRL